MFSNLIGSIYFSSSFFRFKGSGEFSGTDLESDLTIPRHSNGSFVYRPHPPNSSASSEDVLFSILTSFHPNAFTRPRFGPRGCHAVVVKKTRLDDVTTLVDVVFRLHAEFQLNSEPDPPLWLTPAQFLGRLRLRIVEKESPKGDMRGEGSESEEKLGGGVIETEPQTFDSASGTCFISVTHFLTFVPAFSSLNADLEWMNPTSDFPPVDPDWNPNEVDIGLIPRMKIVSDNLHGDCSEEENAIRNEKRVENVENEEEVIRDGVDKNNCLGKPDSVEEELSLFFDSNNGETAASQDDASQSSLSIKDALKTLENHFYPFKAAVDYLAFPDAVAAASGFFKPIRDSPSPASTLPTRPIHAILLWGSLDDQSC